MTLLLIPLLLYAFFAFCLGTREIAGRIHDWCIERGRVKRRREARVELTRRLLNRKSRTS
jgi:hypothetical protein